MQVIASVVIVDVSTVWHIFSAAKRMSNEYFSLKVKLLKSPYETDLLHSLGVLLGCNGIKVPSSRNPFSLSLLDKKNEQVLFGAQQ